MAYQVYFQYRKKGAASWTDTTNLDVSTSQDFDTYVTGLDGGITYEFRAVLEEDDVIIDYGEIEEFTTLPDTSSDTIYTITKPISFVSTKEINGWWGADMRILPDDYIEPESYIEKDGELYIVKNIKKIKSGGKTYFDVKLYHNMIELSELTIDRFNLLDSPSDLLALILDGTDWTAGTCDIDENVYLKLDRRMSRLEALNLLAERCGGELYWHSKDRIVDLKREIGAHTGLQIRYDKNATYIEKEEDSQDLITRIYAYGSDNFAMNTIPIEDCDDESLWTPSGGGNVVASDNNKMQGSQAIEWNATALNETCTRDLVSGINLSGCNIVKLWIYSATANASGVQFGIGESAYTENTVNSGALRAECWHEIELDLSAVADANKDAIRYLGFKNLTNGAATIIFDDIRSFSDVNYIDSPNINKYKIKKEYTYRHSAKPEKQTFEKIIYPSDDTYAYQYEANATHGNSSAMGMKSAADIHISFIKFDLSIIPDNATIESASLYMYCFYVYASGITASVYLSTANWSGATLTYNNMPAAGALVGTLSVSVGQKNLTITDTVNDWISGTVNNYGLRMIADNWCWWYTKEAVENKPYIVVKYSLVTDPSDVIRAGALDYMIGQERDIPKLKYKFNIVDLSRVIKNTWEEETIDIGDTCRAYDSDLDINTNVRVVKIVRNHLDPTDVQLELANKSYTMADLEAKRSKQLSYAMPFKDRPNIIDASAIQAGQIGEDVNK